MASKVARRVINFANLPIKLEASHAHFIHQHQRNCTQNLQLQRISFIFKIEIKRVLESLYGFEVDEVRTLNMEGKKKKRGGNLIAKPDYKKAYVTLRNPLLISPDLYPIHIIEEERKKISKQSESSMVDEQESKSHWLMEVGISLRSSPTYEMAVRIK